ncbi:aldose epimerase family protein [Pedobacter psychroterrae]|uniref:Aldose 1-epimerase n=1 Tax=Pedobacter psychroterrae TaxID=2530453 RepID=A0A4R0NJS2_9SPHI|nr:aldose epimerase family protein [Pedobacter psychroterrae]TCD00078.1 galactose mutarotase [Pedobacter psychroterrae]
MNITKKRWGSVDGQEIHLFRLDNSNGSYVELTNYGATVVSVYVPDKQGKLQNVVLGFNSLAGYLQDNCYIGATVGRFANRIANARFTLDGVNYLLEPNDGVHTNHSASAGFNDKVFNYNYTDGCLVFKYLSPDMFGGYPGNLDFEISYQWTAGNELRIIFKACTDRKTVVNFTNHCYFNLAGTAQKIFDHRLTIQSGSIVEAGADYIPTGRIIDAGQLSFQNTRIVDRMTAVQSHIKGLNVCYVLDCYEPKKQQLAAVLTEHYSGRELAVYTTYPGIMLYTGAYLDSKVPGNRHVTYQPFDGLCLECQYFPDSPNQPDFPSTVLLPGEVFEETITYAFNTKK